MNELLAKIIEVEPQMDETKEPSLNLNSKFSQSNWYKDNIFYLKNLICSPTWDKSKARSTKLKAVKYCILEEKLFWKDPGSIFLNCLIEEEIEGIFIEFHKRVCGGHHAWTTISYKILKASYYWPSLFSDMNFMVGECVEYLMFAGKKKLFPLPLRPIKVKTHFSAMGIEFYW
jgi:hypothetical protein